MNREGQAAQSIILELAAKTEKPQAIQHLTELVAHIEEARACSRNLGRLYEFMHEDKDGRFVIRFYRQSRDEARQPGCMGNCPVDFGDVIMHEDCYAMVYDPAGEKHPIKFIFNYFFDTHGLYIIPERLETGTLYSIIDWIKKTINY